MSSRIFVDEDEPAEDVREAPFECRHVEYRKGKWCTDEFETIDFLGRGKFGEVKRCVETSTGLEFAAKFICTPRPQDRKDVEHEVNIMKKLRHRRLVQLYDAFDSKKEMCLVLEIVYGGELFDRVVSEDFVLSERACVCFARQICEGVEYMHSKTIIHLDLKPENILCLSKSGNRIKIIDFGLAREFDPKGETRVMFGTPEFMAPEVVQYDPIDFSTDMWSFGVICYVLLSGLSPFMGDTDVETLSNVSRAKYDFGYPEFDHVSEDAKDFISRLLLPDKKKRMTARQSLNHVWIKKVASNPSTGVIAKTQLKHFVYRRKWQKATNVVIALKRMGWNVNTSCNFGVNCQRGESHGKTKRNAGDNNLKAETVLRGALKTSPVPQVRCRGVAKVKTVQTDSASCNSETSDNCNLPSSKSDPGVDTRSTTKNHTAAATTSATKNPIAAATTTITCNDKAMSDHKKCRKVVEHTSPGNGHVFNLAKIVGCKSRQVKNEFRPSIEDGMACHKNDKNGNNADNSVAGSAPGGDRNNVTSGTDPASTTSTKQGSNGDRPLRRNLLIREKIRFFNQIDEGQAQFNKPKSLFREVNT